MLTLMHTYVAFLRAINLGARRRFPMAELRACLEGAGFGEVTLHGNTGNARFTSERPITVDELDALLQAHIGFEVPTVILSPAELVEVASAAEAMADPLAAVGGATRRYVTFLRQEPEPSAARELQEHGSGGTEAITIRGRAAHWWLRESNQASQLSNAIVERALGVCTTRDLNVVRKLAQRWG